ncbi:cuticle protein 16.8-like [Stegodyphus dumicola]|uniref:cuticle protein 16.8-like n=1 Tax=Stegodyphus dumicola TaxID=202533 RepID=UPI0015B2B3FB|nr:cuticle protein 16.8-like [Stegodyphus dumicola]
MKKVTIFLVFFYFCCKVKAQERHLQYRAQNEYEKRDAVGEHYHEYHHKPHPYHFGYNIKDEKGNSQWHKEESDAYNNKKGSYGYTDAYGVYRHVDYIADHDGFRVKIRTNEPGTASSYPAHAYFDVEAPPQHVYSSYQKPAHYESPPQQVYASYQKPAHSVAPPQHAYSSYQKPIEAALHQEEEQDNEYPNSKERYTYVPVYVEDANRQKNY